MKSTVSKHLIKNIPVNIGSQKNPRFCYENIVTIIIFLSGAILIALYGYKYANNLSEILFCSIVSLTFFGCILGLIFIKLRSLFIPKDRLYQYGCIVDGIYETNNFDSAMDYFGMYTIKDISKCVLMINNGKKPIGYAKCMCSQT